MIYAPVCIPTLNRYEHLHKCLESLSRCTWADQTEVYVALDYPPLDKWNVYAPGWEKNREFLHSCGDMGFKKLHLIEREENYGIWLPGHKGNLKCLVGDIKKMYDRYIISEDDNVFAPCFLEYMDKGLEKFENDSSVFSIGGYKFFYPILTDGANYIRQSVDYSPWGVGEWTSKKLPDVNYKWYRKNVTLRKLAELKNLYGWGVVSGVIGKMNKFNVDRVYIDNDVWTFMQMTGVDQIIPAKTLVHNIGLDGSGLDMPDSISNNEDWSNPELNPLSSDEHFDFVGTGLEHYEENRKVYYHGKYWKTKRKYIMKTCKKIIKLVIGR